MNFADMQLDERLVRAVNEMGYETPTAIQEKAIPILKKGHDMIAQSETGSGKTAAFGLPILEKIEQGKGIQALIVTPTRELAEQIAKEFTKFAAHLSITHVLTYGGVSINPQIDNLKRAEIVIGTPGRILDHLNRRTMNLSGVRFLVLDEADRMLDMGFIDDVEKIINTTPKTRQTMLFSATMPYEIVKLSKRYLRNPQTIATKTHVERDFLEQVYYDVMRPEKYSLLVHLLHKEKPSLAMVFCATREQSDLVAKNLKKDGIEAKAIHGGLTQHRRNTIMEGFHGGKIHVLVCTDVAARGLDVKNVSHIFNYDLPKTSDDYTHRIGRTARAGEKGKAIALLSPEDHQSMRRILQDQNLSVDKAVAGTYPRLQFRRSFQQEEGEYTQEYVRRQQRFEKRRSSERGPPQRGGHSTRSRKPRSGRR
ncbi:MAG: DEAD/DEAH box helicase [Nanoarchaeota archaeon]|nr:DEAD/DEAH box helicase [Nanoarchaeota archaeon]